MDAIYNKISQSQENTHSLNALVWYLHMVTFTDTESGEWFLG